MEGTRVIDCGGRTVIPGFIDAHCHLLAYAASLLSLDVSPRSVASVADIQRILRDRASKTPPGDWIRAVGYDETALAEKRHPTRRDLDAAAPNHPVRLVHQSGHASVLNSLALSLAGITIESEEPAGGCIDRDLETGEPTGLLLEMDSLLEEVVPPISEEELAHGVREAAARFLAQGVTSVQDATATNGIREWHLFRSLIGERHLPLNVTLMESIDSLGWVPEEELDGRLRRGPIKIALSELGDEIYPGEQEIDEMVWEAHRRGRQVAVHAVTERGIASTLGAIERALSRLYRSDHRHRIEHCSVCPPELARRLGAAGVIVVTQPSFLHFSGDRYLSQVPPEDLPHLYPLARLRAAGVEVAASSDAPVTPPAPLRSVASAVMRRSAGGRALSPEEGVDVEEALRMHTLSGARAAFEEGVRGSLAPESDADIVVLSADPTAVPADKIADIGVEMTIVRGEVAWRADE
ncbi:MAG: amidohydrolase [Dehalococcoidia bacterium]|nr:amidohydrolase [Dehalococcoidia bacterium]